ncbi:MAG: hypothetical protein M3N38_07815 [Pseudomonadota bacterium]|nr:hypothetical protein [Pseudomonadota bacterium]
MRRQFGFLVATILALPAAGAFGNIMAATIPGSVELPIGLPEFDGALTLLLRPVAEESRSSGIPAPLAIPYLTGLIRGHLLAALALVEVNHYETAVLHSSHPIDEHFAELAKLLPAGAGSELRADLATLNELMALRASRGEILTAYRAADLQLRAIDDRAFGPSGMPDRQILALVVALLTKAADEYENAWSGLELRNAIEYQDGYGFFTYAKAKLLEILPRLRLASVGSADEVATAAERIAMAWPAVTPPDKPAMATSTLRALVAVIEINARRLGV